MTAVTLTNSDVQNMTLAAGITSTVAGPWVYKNGPNATVQVTVTTTSGNGSATVKVEVSNGPDSAPVACTTALGTVTLASAASPNSDMMASAPNTPWKYIRLNVTAIAGTGAAVKGLLGN